MQPNDPNQPAEAAQAPEVEQPTVSPPAASAEQAAPSIPPVPSDAPAQAEPATDVEAATEAPQPQNTADDPDGPTVLPAVEPVQWHAIEYIQHDKSPLWYLGFVVVVVVLMALAVLLIKSWTFAILVPVMAAALMVYSHRPPRELSYVLSEKGLYINDQLHALGEFKSFGVIQDAELHSLMLIPIKRFRPGLTVYFPTDVGERLVDLLGAYLPMQELHLDAFDRIVRKLRI